MYQEILGLLKCPCCGEKFQLTARKTEEDEIVEGFISCSNDHKYEINRGVLNFGSSEQEDSNSWSKYYEEMSPEELDRKLAAQLPEKERTIQKQYLNDIVAKTKNLKAGFLLDVASGRGLLLGKLIEGVSENVHIISTDLSFIVLVYDRLKFKKLSSKVKVSYVACDATAIPFDSDSIDLICTYAGYLNMGSLMEDGLKEAARIVKPSGKVINSTTYLKAGTPGFKNIEKILKEYDDEGMCRFLTKEGMDKLHSQYFKSQRETVSYEGIAEGVEGDLLPPKGEWYAEVIVELKK